MKIQTAFYQEAAGRAMRQVGIYSIISAMIFARKLTSSTLFAGRLLLLLLCSLVFYPGSALQVAGLYSHQVAVSNESDAERGRAFSEALAAVIVKVSGKRGSLQIPAIERALDSAQDYVEGMSYSSKPIEPDGLSDELSTEQRYINVSFAASLIEELLVEQGIPVWDSNRPSVLVWMILQDSGGARSFLTADRNPEIIEIIQQFAKSRALPIIFPLLDFEDRRNLTEDQIWALDDEVISAASERYGADSILSGRLHFTAGGELVGLWQFIFQDEAEVFDGFDQNIESYIDQPLDRITSQLASYFAIMPLTSSKVAVRLRVDGIHDLAAYSSLLNYIRGLALVESVSTAALEGSRLDLKLDLLGSSRQLSELIDLDRDLQVIASSAGNDSLLHYRWTR